MIAADAEPLVANQGSLDIIGVLPYESHLRRIAH